ncbi:MAG: DUF1127 domain-containing protein [Pseudomonadota bacterium]
MSELQHLTHLGRRRAVLRAFRPGKLFALISRWKTRHRQRIQLSHLNDAALKDIGLTRHDVEREIQRPFWY